MSLVISIILILILFVILGHSANITVDALKKISSKLGVPLFLLGIGLGFLTSLPELAIAIHASINNVFTLSLGNLLGGIMTIFGLVLGLGLILNHKVKTDGKITTILPFFGLIMLPFILGLNGALGMTDGLIIIAGYIAVLYHIYRTKKPDDTEIKISIFQKKQLVKEGLHAIIGILVVLVSADLLMRVATNMLEQFNFSPFIIGIIIFSIGTNLPELTVIITSWRKKVQELSVSHMFGSAISNICILGAIALITRINIEVSPPYFILMGSLLLLLTLLGIFYKTKNSLSRIEGIALVSVYLIFSCVQLLFL